LKGPTLLLTCAGRRTSLLKSFLSASHRRAGRTFAADSNRLAPALYFADAAFSLPSVLAPEYIQELLALVDRDNLSLIVPTIDTELRVLSRNSALLEERHCCPLVSSPNLIHLTSDKWLTFLAGTEAGISVPRSWLPQNIDVRDLPAQIFIKPRDGSASQHTYSTQPAKLSEILPLVPNAIIQERLEGDEITIDALLTLDGRPIHYVPRRRIRILAGESIEGVTIDDGDLRAWVLRVLDFASAMGGRGPLTIQAFLTRNGPVLTEINARFGGGFPLTQAAGGDYPEWILQDLAGERIEPRFGNYRRGLYMSRYYVEQFIEEPLWN
jgi:carbamoyl-phosphate synthase large subunit